MPDLGQSVFDAFADDEDLVVWLVDVGDGFDDVYDLAERVGLDWPILLDEQGLSPNRYGELGDSAANFPLNVVIDRDGIIRYLSDDDDPAGFAAAIADALETP